MKGIRGVIVFGLLVGMSMIRNAGAGISRTEGGLRYHLLRCLVHEDKLLFRYYLPRHFVTRNQLNKRTYINAMAYGDSLLRFLQSLIGCWKGSVYKCTDRHIIQSGEVPYHQLLCGAMNVGMPLGPSKWTLKVYRTFGIHITFRQFNLPCTFKCHRARVLIYQNKVEMYKRDFCGNMEPFSIAFKQSECIVQAMTQDQLFEGFNFYLAYEAVDMQSSLVSTETRSYVEFKNSTDVMGYRKQFFFVHTFGNDYLGHRHIWKHYIKSNVLSYACVTFLVDNHTELYDGPGVLSEPINIAPFIGRKHKTCFSGFWGYIQSWHAHNASKVIDYEIRPALHSYGDCSNATVSEGEIHFHASGHRVLCIWEIDREKEPAEIRVEHMSFSGKDMLSLMAASSTMCHYGGLFVLIEAAPEPYSVYSLLPAQYFSLCTNIYSKPSIRLQQYQVNIRRSFLAFATYPKYSRGSAEIYLLKSECKGYHYEYHICKSHMSDMFYQNDRFRDWIDRRNIGIPSCKAVWIIFNRQNKVSYPSRCTIQASYYELRSHSFTGPQHVVIDNWVLPQTTGHSVRNLGYYNFLLNATHFKDFPIDMTELASSVLVRRDSTAKISVTHLRSLSFSLNHTDSDLFAKIVRIKFWQNQMCFHSGSSEEIPANLEHLFIPAERITTFRRQGDRSFFYCKQLLRGSSCFTNQSIVTIDQIHYKHWHKKQLDTIIKIKMVECLELCTLDITLLENLNLSIYHDKIRHLEWKNVTYLKWRILGTERGFRLLFTRTCPVPCSKMCDIEVEFSYYIYKDLDCAYGSTSISPPEKTFANWNIANMNCGTKQLLSGAHSNHRNFHSMACFMPWKSADGLDATNQAFFAGLHRKDKVRQLKGEKEKTMYTTHSLLKFSRDFD